MHKRARPAEVGRRFSAAETAMLVAQRDRYPSEIIPDIDHISSDVLAAS